MSQRPPCKTCLPELYPENQDALRIWQLVSNQRIFAGMSGISVALMHEPVWRLIDEFRITENRMKIFTKVLRVFDHVNEIESQERKLAESKRK